MTPVSSVLLSSLTPRDLVAEFPLLEDAVFHPANKEAINSFFAGQLKVGGVGETIPLPHPQATLAVLGAVQAVLDGGGALPEGGEGVQGCGGASLALLGDMLPHLTDIWHR